MDVYKKWKKWGDPTSVVQNAERKYQKRTYRPPTLEENGLLCPTWSIKTKQTTSIHIYSIDSEWMYETRISYTLDWLKNLASAGADRENDKWNVFLPTRIHEYPEMSSISRLAESLVWRINSATSRNSGNVPSSDHSWYKNAYTVTFTYTSPTTTASNDDSPNTLSSSGQSWKSAEKNGRWFRWSDELSHWKVIVTT